MTKLYCEIFEECNEVAEEERIIDEFPYNACKEHLTMPEARIKAAWEEDPNHIKNFVLGTEEVPSEIIEQNKKEKWKRWGKRTPKEEVFYQFFRHLIDKFVFIWKIALVWAFLLFIQKEYFYEFTPLELFTGFNFLLLMYLIADRRWELVK
jgi:hypothetical protein